MSQSLKLYCDTSQLSLLRQFLEDFLISTSLNELERHQVLLAVEEVTANLIIHSHACNSTEYIQVNTLIENGLLKVEIHDQGAGFNILDYEEPEIDQLITTKRKGGLGIMLVKKFMDKIEFETNGRKNTCRLFKLLNSK
ncbi:ATP-binding protein [Mongoliitalea daihaiensis]|uniref:ATP-binding protein n=1 Tax=Mongoliitalea daihaiensis TaxID=2782006 RepID=UPI0021D47656|nr:ATP-binding protein [Mongoliitalea daihaiensis]UJP66268.1 ATP-binding protein [Mongoliitalea daihaiensis]